MTTHHLDMTAAEANDELRRLVKEIDMAMLTTWDGESLRSRPMSTQDIETDGELWFFTRVDSGKVGEIERYDKVNVSYSDPKHQRFVSVSGSARVLVDTEKARQLWSPHVEQWFKGPTDPELALVCVRIEDVEYWNSDGILKKIVGGFRAAIMGHPYPPGDSVETTVSKAHLSQGERRI